MTVTEQLTSIEEYPENFLTCRTFGHSWKPRRENNPDNPNLVTIVLTCRTCGNQRTDQVSRLTGYVVKRSRKYVDGYLRTKGQPRVQRVTFRLQFVARGA